MSIPLDAPELLNREFLEIRARLLQIAASLDRIDRAEGTVVGDPRRRNIDQSLEILCRRGPDRAEQLQMLFSRPYEVGWRIAFAKEDLNS